MMDPGFPWWVTTAVAAGVAAACSVVVWRARRGHPRAGAAGVGIAAVVVGALAPVLMETGSGVNECAMHAEPSPTARVMETGSGEDESATRAEPRPRARMMRMMQTGSDENESAMRAEPRRRARMMETGSQTCLK